MRMEEAFYNIYMYLYNKNVFEYAQIARSGPKSMIRNIEGSSNKDKIHEQITSYLTKENSMSLTISIMRTWHTCMMGLECITLDKIDLKHHTVVVMKVT